MTSIDIPPPWCYTVHRSNPPVLGAKSVPKIRISDVGLVNLKPADRHLDYWDTALPTFGVRVSPKGTKTFVIKMHNGRQSIGRYPLISLSEARTEAKRRLAEKTLGRIRPASVTFPQAVKLFIEEKAKSRRPNTHKSYEWFLSRLNFTCQVRDILHDDFARALKGVKSPSTNDHVLIAARIFFNWCIKRGYIDKNPTAGLSPHSQKSRSRILSDDELKSIWRACEQGAVSARGKSSELREEAKGEAGISPAYGALPANFARIVKLLILTGPRRNEIASLKSDYIDLDNKTICLPSSLTKNKREHLFPIGSIASATLIASLPTPPGLFFPARGKSQTPFNGWSKSKVSLDQVAGVTDWTLHDLRRTYATNMARLGVPLHVIEKLLNHVSGSISGVAAVYNRHTYEKEMRDAVEKYDAWLTTILDKP